MKEVKHKCPHGECIFKEYCYPYQCLLNNHLIGDKEEITKIIMDADMKSADAKFRLLNKHFKKKHPPKVKGSQIKKLRKNKILLKYGAKPTKQVHRFKEEKKPMAKCKNAKIQKLISTSPVYTFEEFLSKINNQESPNFHY